MTMEFLVLRERLKQRPKKNTKKGPDTNVKRVKKSGKKKGHHPSAGTHSEKQKNDSRPLGAKSRLSVKSDRSPRGFK